jgi:hypothetical protein
MIPRKDYQPTGSDTPGPAIKDVSREAVLGLVAEARGASPAP